MATIDIEVDIAAAAGAAGGGTTSPPTLRIPLKGTRPRSGNRQVTQALLGRLLEVLFRLELILQQFGEVPHVLTGRGLSKYNNIFKRYLFGGTGYGLINTYSGAIFLHWVGHLVVLVFPAFAGKEAGLTHVKVEAFQASIAEATDRGLKTEYLSIL